MEFSVKIHFHFMRVNTGGWVTSTSLVLQGEKKPHFSKVAIPFCIIISDL